MKVIVAPDSFKGTMSATDAAAAITRGWLSHRPTDDILQLPLADGGEGTLDAVELAVPGARRVSAGLVTGPDGRTTPGEWLALPDGTALVELAQPSGLHLMRELDPLGATTLGLGQVIRAAIDSGAVRLVVGLGGSASTDGGAGALAALGLTADGSLTTGGGALAAISRLDRSRLPEIDLLILTDVTTPLLDAPRVFGPQKGATPLQVAELRAALEHFARLFGGDPSAPGSGAAGGTGYGLATWGGRLVSGADWIFAVTGLAAHLADADVVITGEGRFDETSRAGKVVGRVLEMRPDAIVIAGQGSELSLEKIAGSTADAMADPARWLEEAGAIASRRR